MIELEQFRRDVAAVQNRIGSIQQRLQDRSIDPSQVPLELYEELLTSLEELQVAEEELRQQNEELIKARNAVEEERQRYQELFEFAPDGYFVTDTEGVIREANRAAGELLGIPPQFLTGKPLTNYFPVEERRSFRTRLLELKHAERMQVWGVRLKPRSRASFPAALVVTSIRDAAGQVSSLRWLVRDITEAKRTEEQLRLSDRHLEERIRARIARLEASNRTKEELLASEKAAREEAEAAQRRLVFLAGASSLLSASFDLSVMLGQLTRFVAPHLADWCAVDLVEPDGSLRRLAETGDQRIGAAVHKLAAGTHAALGAPAVVESGEPVLANRESPGDSPAGRLPRQRSWPPSCRAVDGYICVPLASRNRTLGAITLALSGSGRWFDAVDLAVAEDLARRTAGAIERARLYQDARSAGEAKDRLVSLVCERLERSVASLDAAAARLREPASGEEQQQQAAAGVEECSRQLAGLIGELAEPMATPRTRAREPLSPRQDRS
jgi:PAS domain S-box-containing protein